MPDLHLRVRPVRPGDVDDRFRLGNSLDVAAAGGTDARWVPEMTPELAERWYAGFSSKEHCWVIDVDDRMVGTVNLHNLDRFDLAAEIRIGILDPMLWGAGLGRRVTVAVLGHAFRDVGLHRVFARVIDVNERAQRMFRACGFVDEGVEREATFFQGVWHDYVRLSVLAGEFGVPQVAG